MNKVLFLIDGEVYEIPFENSDRKVTKGANISEKIDVIVDKKLLNILRKIVESDNEIKIRYKGTEGERTSTLNKKEIQAHRETLAYFDMF